VNPGDGTDIIRIGTRGSELALWQAHHVQGLLGALGARTSLTIIKTQGDRIDDVPLSQLEGKGFFTKELEDAQLDGRVDLAVHSMKDLATGMPAGLVLAALVRPDCVDRDRQAAGELLPLRDGARIGTSAARRQAQLRDLRPDLVIADLRGNVPTRVRKLREGRYDAILLARAGVLRLELDLGDLCVLPLEVDDFVPAPAQGMLALQCRDEPRVRDLVHRLHCVDDGRAVAVERALLERLDGGCQLPFGVNVRRCGDGFRLSAFWSPRDGVGAPLHLRLDGPEPEALGDEALRRIREREGKPA
jgi:hydroxymethylbilane synthase